MKIKINIKDDLKSALYNYDNDRIDSEWDFGGENGGYYHYSIVD